MFSPVLGGDSSGTTEVPPDILNELNERGQIFMANSVELFQLAWKEYLKQGRGAIFAHFKSMEDMATCAAMNRYQLKFRNMMDLLSVNYAPAHETVKVYNPSNSFVIVVVVQHGHGFIFASTAIMRDAQYQLRDAARAAREAAAAGVDVSLIPMPMPTPQQYSTLTVTGSASPSLSGSHDVGSSTSTTTIVPPSVRLCCAIRSAVGLGPCDH